MLNGTQRIPARTRDGGISVASAIQAPLDDDVVTIDVDGARAWARVNGVKEAKGRWNLATVNERRVALLLPPFKIAPGAARRPQDDMPQEVPALSARQSGTSGAEGEVVPPLVRSQDELLNLVVTRNATVTGVITPQIAGWLLDLNTGNRPLQDRGVDRFRALLLEGGWINTGEPIIVSREGVLNDGQHRLTAIQKSGIAAIADVRFGIARDAFAATGTGRRRTVASVLAIAGIAFSSAQASLARLTHHYDAGQFTRLNQQVEPNEVLRIIEDQPQIAEVSAVIQRHRFAPARTAPFGLILAVAARRTPRQRVFQFAEAVNSGLAADEQDPTRLLHLRLRDQAFRRERLSQIDLAALTSLSWNAWIAGRSLTRLALLESHRTNAGFPKVLHS